MPHRKRFIADYCKYAYWTDRKAVKHLAEKLAEQNIAVVEARKAVCVPLSKRIDIGVVSPDIWRKTSLCKRQLSWYWTSPHVGRYLVISSSDLAQFGFTQQIVLRNIKFRPTLLPNDLEIQALIDRPSYLNAKPDEWDNLDAENAARQEQWMKIMGIRGKSFKELFLTHCANHANFIEPQYFIENEGENIPYSIGKTSQICSACLEFFNVIGEKFHKKLVVPCPGAAIFAGLPVNRYIEVETFL